jgi:hypothetical protein
MPVRFVIRCISLLAITSGPSLLRCGLRVTLSTECAHAEVASGDTYQQTTKGVAIYRRADNAPAFVSGMSRWSLTAEGLVQRSTAPDQE